MASTRPFPLWRTLAASAIVVGVVAGLAAGAFDSPAIHAQPTGEAAQLRELAERLLSSPFGAFGGGGQPMTAQLLPGQLPADLAMDLPLPPAPGGRLVGSVARRLGEALVGVEVVHDAPGLPAEVRAFYAEQLSARGWTARETPYRGAPGGFQSFTAPEYTLFCQSEDGPMLTLSVSAREGRPTDVRLSAQMLSAAQGFPFGYSGGPCAAPQPPAGLQPLRPDALPRLSPPTGIQLVATGGSFGANLAGSEALAMTDRSAAELATYFAQQLEEAGWVQTAAGAEGALAWSLWDVPGEDAGQGLLLALESPEGDRVVLSLRLYMARPPFGPQMIFPYSSFSVAP